jgi:CHASE1-domain containing sensor protein
MSRRLALLLGIVAVLCVALLSFAVWSVQRDLHYSFSYGYRVNRDIEQHIAPINRRLDSLEKHLLSIEMKGN